MLDARTGERTDARLDLKALRMAVHGWWLGNPLVYKPGTLDLLAIARELADAGATAGTMILGDVSAVRTLAPGAGSDTARRERRDFVAAVLILRSSRPPLVLAATRAVAEVARAVLGTDRVRVLDARCEVVTEGVTEGEAEGERGATAVPFCGVSVEEHGDVAYLGLECALGQLAAAGADAGGQPMLAFFLRPDWREVFLARVLHTLEAHLKEAH